MKISIEAYKWDEFILKYWSTPDWQHLRFGQAFYNYFDLHKMKQTKELDMLYNSDNDKASKLIHSMFEIH